jgi:hypothetical protein
VDDADDARWARIPTAADVAAIARSLTEAGARYLLVGGFAVIAHGYLRTTKDIDILVDDSPENVARVKQALSFLADNAVAEVGDTDVRDYLVVRVIDEVVVDLMGRACGIDYAEAVRDAESVEIHGVRVPVVSPSTLIRTKQTTRPSDAGDCLALEEILKKRAARG